MLSDELRKRLQKLNRAPLRRKLHLPEFVKSPALRETGIKSSLPPVFTKPAVIKASTTPFIPLDDVVTGREIHNQRGRFLLVEKVMEDFITGTEAVNSRYTDFFGNGVIYCSDKSVHRDLRAFLNSHPVRTLYLDIETTGLRWTPLFLVGLMFFDRSRFHVHQLLARDYAEETAVVQHLKGLIRSFDCIVTFTGKSFDVPFIRERALSNMIDFTLNQDHLDLLHECRRRYRKKLPNCRLQTLEERICGRTRIGDIPGAEIPDAYHNFVRTGNAHRMSNIVHHNGLDLITMVELVLNILSSEV